MGRSTLAAPARIVATAACLLLAQGCSALRPGPGPETIAAWKVHQQQLANVDRFVLSGRFAAGGAFGTKGQVQWIQAGREYQLRLWGPFGAGAMLIRGDGPRAEVRTAQETYETPDAEQDLRQRYGWTLPLAQLRWWVIGIPAPDGQAAMQFDDQGRLSELVQAGWTLEYQEYQTVGARQLPRKLALANDDVTVKLIVDEWSDLPALPGTP